MAKKITYDIVNITDPQTLSRWKKQKVLVPYKPKGWDLLPAVVKDRDGYFTDVGVTANVFAYNSKFVSVGDAPTNWRDFLDPKWKGKIVSAVPRGYGAQYYFYATLTELFGWEYIEQFAKQDILFVRGASRALRMVNSGERVLTPGIPLDRTMNLIRKGNPIGISVPTDFIGLNPRAAGILKDAPHPDGARLLMGFLLTKEAQQIFAAKGSLYPVRSDVSLPTDMAAIPLSKLTPLHKDKFTEEHDRILEKLEATLKIRR
jgi:iron(III) transport system substrate-binding protein